MGRYEKPVLRTFDCYDLVEAIGPVCTQYGAMDIDMYRGEEAVELKTYEYRVAEMVDFEKRKAEILKTIQEKKNV